MKIIACYRTNLEAGCTGFMHDAEKCCWGLGEQNNMGFKSSMRDNEKIIRYGEQEM